MNEENSKKDDKAKLKVEKSINGIKISLSLDITIEPISNTNQAELKTQITSQKEIEDKETEETEETRGNIHEVKSPVVGTFYHAPSPDADPFVKVGSFIKEKDILCIIEAMKVMNEIEAEVSGKVVKILVDNAQSVEFGDILFHIEPVEPT